MQCLLCVCVCVQSFRIDSLLLLSRQNVLDSFIIHACSLQCSCSDVLTPRTLSSFPIFPFHNSFLLPFNSECHLMVLRGEKYSGCVFNRILVYSLSYTMYLLCPYTMQCVLNCLGYFVIQHWSLIAPPLWLRKKNCNS